MKGPLVALTSIFAAFAGFFGWYCWDSSSNHGLEFGYFGEFNRLVKATQAVPGTVIAESAYNGDVTLEEIWLKLSVAGVPVDLFFGERDPVRAMSHAAAVGELKKRIAAAAESGK
jgi:hypothetical protein